MFIFGPREIHTSNRQQRKAPTMYASGNPQTKKQLREWIAAGKRVECFSPGPYPAPTNGTTTIEGPQYPRPHRWYSRVEVRDGIITKVVS